MTTLSDDVKALLVQSARIETRVDSIHDDLTHLEQSLSSLSQARHDHHVRLIALEARQSTWSRVWAWAIQSGTVVLLAIFLWFFGIKY